MNTIFFFQKKRRIVELERVNKKLEKDKITERISANKKYFINLENQANKGTPPSEKRPDRSGNSKKREKNQGNGGLDFEKLTKELE